GSNGLEPIRVFLQCKEKLFEPSVLVAMFRGARPDAEFLHIVAHGGGPTRMSARRITQVFKEVGHAAEGDQIAQILEAREKPNHITAILSNVSLKKLLRLESGGKKMDVVDKRVSDAGVRQNAGELRLPNALSKPGSRWPLAKVLFDVGAELGEL